MAENKKMPQLFDDDSFDLEWDFADSNEVVEDTEENIEETDEELEGSNLRENDIIEDEAELDGADEFGTEVDLSTATMPIDTEYTEEDAEYSVITPGKGFIDDSGNLVVQDIDDHEDSKRFEFLMLPIEKISIAAERIRKTNNFESLYKSIKSTGLLQPIMVAPTKTDGYYILLHGFRRLQACAKCGMKVIPCIVNHRVKTSEIPILEALYNHSSEYKMKDLEHYIDYLEKEQNIMNASLIEYLTQWNNGDYNKFKDIKEDADPDIYGKLMEDQIGIAQAFKNLENRRKKESKEEKELKVTSKAYSTSSDESEAGIDVVAGAGETAGIDEVQLSNEEVKSLIIDPTKIDGDISDKSLDEMVEEGKNMAGFEDHKQDWRDRERIDPAIRKAVMSRDNNTCQCCKRGGPDYVDILDLHHIVEVYLGGVDSVDNGVALCLNCHKQVHLYVQNKLHIPKTKTAEELDLEIKQMLLKENADREKKGKPALNEEQEQDFIEQRQAVYKEEQDKYKRIIYLGNIIRTGLQMKGKKLEDYKKEHPVEKIGRQKPGEKNTVG